MEKVRPWCGCTLATPCCGQPSDRGRLKKSTELVRGVGSQSISPTVMGGATSLGLADEEDEVADYSVVRP